MAMHKRAGLTQSGRGKKNGRGQVEMRGGEGRWWAWPAQRQSRICMKVGGGHTEWVESGTGLCEGRAGPDGKWAGRGRKWAGPGRDSPRQLRPSAWSLNPELHWHR